MQAVEQMAKASSLTMSAETTVRLRSALSRATVVMLAGVVGVVAYGLLVGRPMATWTGVDAVAMTFATVAGAVATFAARLASTR